MSVLFLSFAVHVSPCSYIWYSQGEFPITAWSSLHGVVILNVYKNKEIWSSVWEKKLSWHTVFCWDDAYEDMWLMRQMTPAVSISYAACVLYIKETVLLKAIWRGSLSAKSTNSRLKWTLLHKILPKHLPPQPASNHSLQTSATRSKFPLLWHQSKAFFPSKFQNWTKYLE